MNARATWNPGGRLQENQGQGATQACGQEVAGSMPAAVVFRQWDFRKEQFGRRGGPLKQLGACLQCFVHCFLWPGEMKKNNKKD